MRKLLFSIALCLPAFAMMGCGGSTETTVTEGQAEETMSQSQQDEYEAAMRSGAGASDRSSAGSGPTE